MFSGPSTLPGRGIRGSTWHLLFWIFDDTFRFDEKLLAAVQICLRQDGDDVSHSQEATDAELAE